MPAASVERQGTGCQGLLIDAQPLKAPRPKVERLHVELQRVREEAILNLQMLRIENRPFGPDDRLEYRHGTQRTRIGRAEQSAGASGADGRMIRTLCVRYGFPFSIVSVK